MTSRHSHQGDRQSIGWAGSIDQLPRPRLDHLSKLTGPKGLFEHARYDEPRIEHGYTTDDNARALSVLAALGTTLPITPLPIAPYRGFVLSARNRVGWHNRLSHRGRWLDRVGSDDSQGRAIWGLSAIALPHDLEVNTALAEAVRTFDSPHPRANAYAVIGLANLVADGLSWAEPHLFELTTKLPAPRAGRWRWPEHRLTYANARLPQALILAGDVLALASTLQAGLDLLDWLIDSETLDECFSFTPHTGRGLGDRVPAFDQQPIEAWAMADAALAAWRIEGSGRWLDAIEDASMWFMGRNDVGLPLYDHSTGAGYDGLHRDRVNLNRGAESTLSALGALAAAHLSRQASLRS